MSDNPRDAQFTGFAAMLFEELKPELTLLFVELGRKSETGIGSAENIVRQHLARRAYDLACHTVSYLDNDVGWRMGKGYTAARIVENDVPDMTTWTGEMK